MPLDLFEQFAIGEETLPKLLRGVHGCRNISEALVLSTCNRTEVYVYAEKFPAPIRMSEIFLLILPK